MSHQDRRDPLPAEYQFPTNRRRDPRAVMFTPWTYQHGLTPREPIHVTGVWFATGAIPDATGEP